MKPFSLDLRQRVLADHEAGLSFAELGRKYSTSAEWVRQFIRRYQATGEVAARPPIPKTVRFAEAPAVGRSILSTSRRSKGAQAYRDVAASLMSRL